MKIDELVIPTPQGFKVTNRRIENSNRTASGRLVVDVIANKKVFNLDWNAIHGDKLKGIIDALADFATLEYEGEEGIETAEVYLTSEITRELIIKEDRLYIDVSLTLEEQ